MRKSQSEQFSDIGSLGREHVLSISRSRAQLLGAILVVPFVVLVARLWYLQVMHGDEFLHAAQSNRTRILRIEAARGEIIDANGSLLAADRPQFAVYAVAAIAHDKGTVARLAQILKINAADLTATLSEGNHTAYAPVRIALDVPLSVVTTVEEERPYLPGVSTAPEPVRWYPQGSLLSSALGTLGRIDPDTYKLKRSAGYFPDDFVGKTGLEDEYESLLHGEPGGTLVEVKARGTTAVNVGEVDPVPGKTLRLTVRHDVQAAAEQSLAAHGWTGAAVALDPNTGAVIALASSPAYDPNAFAKGIDRKTWDALRLDPQKPMLDRAVDSLYPPGSTFKQITAVAGLESGAISTSTVYHCNGALMLDKARFGCWAIHGDTDFYKAIAESCDVYFYRTGLGMGPQFLANTARQYPLARPTGIDLPHEMTGTIPDAAWKANHFRRLPERYRAWHDGDTLNMSIGQGFVLATPLQMALVTSVTANGGTVYKPYLVDKVIDPTTGAVVQQTTPQIENQLTVKPESLAATRAGMRQCVTDGTGKIVDFNTLRVAAKTGSAEVTGSDKADGWFVAFAPYDHPVVAMAALVEHGGHGGDTAGQVVRAMMKAYFKLVGDSGGSQAASD